MDGGIITIIMITMIISTITSLLLLEEVTLYKLILNILASQHKITNLK